MPYFRRPKGHDHPYAQIANEMLEDSDLSFKAKGLMSYLLAQSDNWEVYQSQLIEVGTDGEVSVRSAMEELEENGYLESRRKRGEDGQFEGIVYVIYERGNKPPAAEETRPDEEDTEIKDYSSKTPPSGDSSKTRFSSSGLSSTEKPRSNNNKNNNTKNSVSSRDARGEDATTESKGSPNGTAQKPRRSNETDANGGEAAKGSQDESGRANFPSSITHPKGDGACSPQETFSPSGEGGGEASGDNPHPCITAISERGTDRQRALLNKAYYSVDRLDRDLLEKLLRREFASAGGVPEGDGEAASPEDVDCEQVAKMYVARHIFEDITGEEPKHQQVTAFRRAFFERSEPYTFDPEALREALDDWWGSVQGIHQFDYGIFKGQYERHLGQGQNEETQKERRPNASAYN